MTYRDDLEAARAKIEQLEEQLEEAHEEVAKLKAPASPTAIEKATEVQPELPRGRALGRSIYYARPPTYVPLLHLLRAAVLATWHRMPRLSGLSSDNLLVIIGYWLIAWPFVYLLWRPVYVACAALILLPAAALLSLLLTVVLFPIIVLARLRVGDSSHDTGMGWPEGDYDEDDGAKALWILMSFTMQPLLPVFIPLLSED
jgi:hypothetical protein